MSKQGSKGPKFSGCSANCTRVDRSTGVPAGGAVHALHLHKRETWSTNQEAKQTRTASGKENPSLHAMSSSPSLQEGTFPVPNWSTPFAASVRSRNSLTTVTSSSHCHSQPASCSRKPLESHSAVTARLAPVLSVRAKPAGHAWNTTSRGLDQHSCRNKLSHRAEACRKKPFPAPSPSAPSARQRQIDRPKCRFDCDQSRT